MLKLQRLLRLIAIALLFILVSMRLLGFDDGVGWLSYIFGSVIIAYFILLLRSKYRPY